MLLSRFWYLALSAAAVMGIAAALLARGIINRQYLENVDDGLRRDRFEVESILKLEARARLDTLAPIAADGVVREAVRTSGNAKIDGQDGQKALKSRLRTLNQQLEELRADLLIAVDAEGQIVAQEGRKQAREGAGLGEIPVVAAALAGFIGDDVWVYDGGVYRIAARPVVDRGQLVGALVHGQRLDTTLAQRVSERIGGASVAFFFGEEVIASYTPTDVIGAPTQAETGAALGAVLADEDLQKGDRSGIIDLEGRGRAVYSLVAGSASELDVGYVLARPYKLLESPWAVFGETKKEDVSELPTATLVIVFILMLALAMGTVYLERDRPLTRLNQQLDKVIDGKGDELDLAVLSGAYRKVGERVNRAIDVSVTNTGGQRKQQRANLDEILGPTPENLTSSAFSFGAGDGGTDPGPGPASVSMPSPSAMPAPMPAPVVMPPPGAGRAAPPPVASAPPLRVPAPPPARSKPSGASFSPADGKSVSLRIDGSSDDEATVVAEVPDELREESRDSEPHFREVFEQYVALRQQCGESTSELTFEKLAVTLRKNRDQILMQRPETKDVRFTVYVKAGKAALKATPVKA